MNFGFLCNEMPPAPAGGIGTFTTELVRGLTELGHGVHVISVDKQVNSNVSEIISPGLTIHRIPGKPGRLHGCLTRFQVYLLIRKLAAHKQIDVVEIPDFEGWCAGWGELTVPVIVRLHGSASYFGAEMNNPAPPPVRFLERLAVRRADHVVSVSRYTMDRSEEVFGFPLSATVIHNSVVLPAADQVKADFAGRDLVCFSGTLVEKKGVFSLAQAWSLVKQRRPNARLMLIGKDGGHCGRPAIQVIRELAGNYADSIDCLGHRPKAEVEALLATADIAVYPSYSETFALAPMEAMALCVPTIYTTRASGPELIRHGIDGWLCDPGNINDLASQIVTLLESESLRRQLGEAGRRRIIDSCSYSAFLQKNLNFYRRCIGQSHLCAGTAN